MITFKRDGENYIGPPWIDLHCHIFHGFTSFGLSPDDIGLKQGVHLLVDAGSAGAETFAGFRDYVLPRNEVPVRAFLHISAIGLTTMRECFDLRNLDVKRAVEIARDNPLVAGIKVRSSAIILEDKGIKPLELALEAAEIAHLPVMVHMGENPPDNAENLKLLRRGDIITHCFHGKEKPLWQADGRPIPALKDALDRGVLLDVGHGAASLSKQVAASAMGNCDFTISTDLHGRSFHHPVRSLAHTMTKFLSLGLSLEDVIEAVSLRPAKILGLTHWGEDVEKNATVFTLRPKKEGDDPFVDAVGESFPVNQVIQPVAVILNGKYREI